MYIAPNTNIVLLKNCPLDNTYQHTIYFENISAQTSYFKTLSKYTFTKQSYQRLQKGSMRLSRKAEDLYDCNYLMFQNESFGNKWFYAFVKSVDYVNNETSEITYEVDVMQTWMFDYNLRETFVVREHVMSDEIGEHTVPEGLETGPYELAKKQGYNYDNYYVVINASDFPYDESGIETPASTSLGGVPIAGGLWAYPVTAGAEVWVFEIILAKYAKAGKLDSIANVYLLPGKLLLDHMYGESMGRVGSFFTPDTDTFKITKKIDYAKTCKNNKLYTYPYCYHAFSNNAGNTSILKPELFSDEKPTFKITSVPVPGGSIKCTPLNYGCNSNESNDTELESLMGGKFPTLSWSADNYTNWLTQNALNLGVGIIGGTASTVAGAVTANPAAIAGGISGVFNNVNQIYQHSLCPETAKGNTNGGDVQTCSQLIGFNVYSYRIREEYRQIIDDYFTMYGYKVNTVKIPNISGRKRWNYVQTQNIVLTGSVPCDDMNRICNIYDHGITFWKNGADIGHYNLDNSL